MVWASRSTTPCMMRLPGRQPVTFEAWFAWFDAWFEVHAFPSADGLGVYFRDVTERQQALQALQEREEYFRAMVEHSADITNVLNADGTVRYTSPAHRRLLGYDEAAGDGDDAREDGFGRSMLELVHPDDVQMTSALFRQVMEAPGIPVTSEVRIRHQDGSWRIVEATATNLLGNPAVHGIVINSRDITAYRQAETELRESNQRFRQLADNITKVFWISELPGSRNLYVSPAFKTIWGRPLDSLAAGPTAFLETIHPDDRHLIERRRQQNAAGHPTDDEYRVLQPGGAIRWVRDRCLPDRR